MHLFLLWFLFHIFMSFYLTYSKLDLLTNNLPYIWVLLSSKYKRGPILPITWSMFSEIHNKNPIACPEGNILQVFLWVCTTFVFVILDVTSGYTMQCHYNMVSFLQNPDNRHPIARPWGWGMGCLLWILIPIYVLPQLLECCMRYPVVLDRVTTALNCTRLYLDRTQRDIIFTISITFIHMLHLPVTFRVASMALRQVHDFLSISCCISTWQPMPGL